MKIIKNVTRDDERAFYNSKNIKFCHVKIDGPADGESAFKESKNIIIEKSDFKLRYPLWHNKNVTINKCKFSLSCRAPFWYDNNLSFNGCFCKGVKAIRECSNVNILESTFISPEIAWRSKNINIKNSAIESVYAFFECKNVTISDMQFKGKYSFQYVKNMEISNSVLDTKDAFWHSENVVVKDSIIKGEYLGWYSKNLTLINCKISGTQPLCYCKNLTLINCETENCDLCFEYSEVDASIKGNVVSIVNPLKGKIVLSGTTQFVQDKFDKSNSKITVIQNKL